MTLGLTPEEFEWRYRDEPRERAWELELALERADVVAPLKGIRCRGCGQVQAGALSDCQLCGGTLEVAA